ncbi:MAG: hypothetical protein R6X20_07325 [Phycisphaerae bacterium]
MPTKLVLLCDRNAKPLGDANMKEIESLLEQAEAAGISCQRLDTKDMDETELKEWRNKAFGVATRFKQRIRQAFGSQSQGMLPYFGKEVPALFVYEEGEAEPVAVYPHRKAKERRSIEGYLRQMLES